MMRRTMMEGRAEFTASRTWRYARILAGAKHNFHVTALKATRLASGEHAFYLQSLTH
jgi:hypothetical protein